MAKDVHSTNRFVLCRRAAILARKTWPAQVGGKKVPVTGATHIKKSTKEVLENS